MTFINIIIIIGVVIFNAIVAIYMKNAAAMKGYGENFHIWAVCFWLGIFGCLYVVSLPDSVTQEQNQRIIELLNERKGDL